MGISWADCLNGLRRGSPRRGKSPLLFNTDFSKCPRRLTDHLLEGPGKRGGIFPSGGIGDLLHGHAGMAKKAPGMVEADLAQVMPGGGPESPNEKFSEIFGTEPDAATKLPSGPFMGVIPLYETYRPCNPRVRNAFRGGVPENNGQEEIQGSIGQELSGGVFLLE